MQRVLAALSFFPLLLSHILSTLFNVAFISECLRVTLGPMTPSVQWPAVPVVLELTGSWLAFLSPVLQFMSAVTAASLGSLLDGIEEQMAFCLVSAAVVVALGGLYWLAWKHTGNYYELPEWWQHLMGDNADAHFSWIAAVTLTRSGRRGRLLRPVLKVVRALAMRVLQLAMSAMSVVLFPMVAIWLGSSPKETTDDVLVILLGSFALLGGLLFVWIFIVVSACGCNPFIVCSEGDNEGESSRQSGSYPFKMLAGKFDEDLQEESGVGNALFVARQHRGYVMAEQTLGELCEAYSNFHALSWLVVPLGGVFLLKVQEVTGQHPWTLERTTANEGTAIGPVRARRVRLVLGLISLLAQFVLVLLPLMGLGATAALVLMGVVVVPQVPMAALEAAEEVGFSDQRGAGAV